MTRKDTVDRYSRMGLIVAAFALVTAIVGQPLWRGLWPTPIEVTDSGQTRTQ